jgi:hypothetical protein
MDAAVYGGRGNLRVVVSLTFVFCLIAPRLRAQEPASCSALLDCSESAQAASPDTQQGAQPEQPGTSSAPNDSAQFATKPSDQNFAEPGPNIEQTPPLPGQQPKRILGLMPNFRAVSAGTIPPPPTLRQSFKIATQNSFDYSAFAFVGITSLLSEATDGHPQLGGGFYGFTHYYWRGFADKTDGNYWVIFVLPTLFRQDERYFALGQGGAWKRLTYSATRIFITPSYHGHNSFNASELLGRGISQGLSLFYYPSQTRTAGALSQKYGYALGRDALTNIFREFWPDIATHVLHRHP